MLWLVAAVARLRVFEPRAEVVGPRSGERGYWESAILIRVRYNLPITNEGVAKAILRSKAHQTESGEIPGQMETRIHRVIEELVNMRIISIPN